MDEDHNIDWRGIEVERRTLLMGQDFFEKKHKSSNMARLNSVAPSSVPQDIRFKVLGHLHTNLKLRHSSS